MFSRPPVPNSRLLYPTIGAIAFLCFYQADFKLEGEAKLRPKVRQNVYAQVDGPIEKVNVEHDQFVHKGDVILVQRSYELEKQIEQSLKDFKDAPALILDLRGNGGGDGEFGLRFAGYFFNDQITVAKIVTRSGKPPVPEMPMLLETGTKGAQIFARPLVILVNEGTASTSELVTNALQEQKRAVVFGTNSCGCVLAFLDYKPLTGGGDLTLSEFGFITAKGKKLEGSGVTPDRIVAPNLKDLQTGRDAALRAAERFLSN